MILKVFKPFFYLFLLLFLPLLLSNYLLSLSEGLGFWDRLLRVFLLALLTSLILSLVLIFYFTDLSEPLANFRRLNRFESLSHPLLVKLSLEAPGTYQHSLNVATLAYKAAKGIGANALLARIGAYYHDIGKLKNPSFFIENQNGQNIHDQILPKESAKTIIDHVLYGDNLAKEFHLPEEIRAFIREHQGAGLLDYFYKKAQKLQEEGVLQEVKEADFYYPGPKPQSKETAIVLLADAVEAKARSLEEVNPESLEKLLEETFQEKKASSQLSESSLSERELVKIKKIFLNTLLSIYHKRIAYQKLPLSRPVKLKAKKNEIEDFGL